MIRRGQLPPQDTEFGRKVWYSEVDGGLISDYRLLASLGCSLGCECRSQRPLARSANRSMIRAVIRRARHACATAGGPFSQVREGKTRTGRKTVSYLAEAYESYLVPSLFAPWASRLLRSANPQSGQRVLDVACGTGIVARQAARQVGSTGRVTGLDLRPDMLGVARAAAERNGQAIAWCRGRAERLGFPDGQFDLVVCQFGLMLFADRHAAVSEMRRVLARGGRAVVSVWQGLERHPFYQTLHDVSRRRLGTSGVQAAFSLGEAGELRRLLAEAGFQQVEIEPVSLTARFSNPAEFLDWEIDVDPAAVPALRHLEHQAQQAILAAVRADMQPPLHAAMQANQLLLPFHAHIARASR